MKKILLFSLLIFVSCKPIFKKCTLIDKHIVVKGGLESVLVFNCNSIGIQYCETDVQSSYKYNLNDTGTLMIDSAPCNFKTSKK